MMYQKRNSWLKHSDIVISNGMKHDAFAMKEFEKEAHFLWLL